MILSYPTAPSLSCPCLCPQFVLCTLLVSDVEHLLCFICLILCLFLPLSFPQAPTPLSDGLPFNSPLEQREIRLGLRQFSSS